MTFSKHLFLTIVFFGQATFASSQYVPSLMRDLPTGTTITINQDIYFEPGENEFVWKYFSNQGVNTQSVRCEIRLRPDADTSQGLLLKAPIVMSIKENSAIRTLVVGNKKSIESMLCIHVDLNGGDYFEYAMSVSNLKFMLKRINGSLSVPASPQE
ncbi:hypothetical protein B9G69_009670 [Bdellovibrio sp. SKB1291214]|uniref:hypothetical protein n=1 Tax=Bdellovibrio sp. SKB1291214 TaxID=1732569 RepID=UPI000B517072|nr:hypothetical protein [Bdellovibrio sp. SKB1291214]UYL07313.1 hypothetical protein B9G69_009670 [Bdellovibrio sp. SKB1291214]